MGQFDAFFTEVKGQPDLVPADVRGLQTPDPAAPAATGTGFALPQEIFEEAQKDEVTRVKSALFQVKDQVPGAYAEAEKLAKELNLPIDIVHRNMPEMKVQARLKGLQDVLDKDPVLRRWMLDDPRRITMMEPDELDEVSGLNWLFQSTAQAWQSGEELSEMNYFRFLELEGDKDPVKIARADYLSHKWEGRTFGAEGWWEKAVVQTAQMAPMMGHGLVGFGTEKDIKYGSAGAAAGATIAGATTGGLGIPGGAVTGYALVQSSIQQMGSAYNDFRSIVDEDGTPLDPEVARVAAIISGTASGVLDVVALKKVAERIPGLDKVLDGGGKAGMRAALKNPKVRDAFKAVAKNVFEAGAIEITTEVAQTAINLAAQELAKTVDGSNFEMMTAEQWMTALGDTAIATAQVMSLVGPMLASPKLMTDFVGIRRAGDTMKILTKIGDNSTLKKMAVKSPEATQSAVDAVAAGTPAAEVHIPVGELTQLFQDEGSGSVFDFGKDIEGWNDRINDAMVSGGDVTLTMGEYVAHVVPSKRAAEFAAVAKLDRLDPTAKSVETLNTEVEKITGQMLNEARKFSVKQAQETVSGKVEQRAQIGGVPESIAKQYGVLYGEFFKTMADRTGKDENELFDKYSLSIANPDTEIGSVTGETYAQSADKVTPFEAQLKPKIPEGVTLKTVKVDDNTVSFDLETSPPMRYQGLANKAMSEFTAMADAQGVRAVIIAEPTPDAISMKDLKKFYKKHGFKDDPAAGKNRMVREPATTLKQEKRGSITFSDTGVAINLFKAQNMSTFLHESGHFFLKVMQDLAAMPDAPAEIVADWATLEKALDFKGKPTVEAHEKFARTFEAYLFEGKAPSHKLRQVFQRARAWLLAVYRHVRRIGGVPSPEVAGVMDRMLASDWAINAVRENEEYEPAFNDPALLSPEEWVRYNKLVEAHTGKARDDLTYRVLQDTAIKVRGDMAVYKREMKAKVRERLKNSPTYKTIDRLRKGTEFTRPIRIDEAEVRRIYGDQVADAMPSGTIGDSSVMHPDEIAELMGDWKSGDQMITALAGAKPLNEAVNEELTRVVEQKFGDKYAVQEMTVREANQVMHIVERTAILEFEIKALQKMGGKDPNGAPAKFARELAERKVRSQKIKDVSKFTQYVAAERAAAMRADKAIADRRYNDAAEFKRQQLYSHQMGKVAQETLREVEKMRLYAVKMLKKPTKIDVEYVDQIKSILGRFEFAKIPLDKLLKRESLLVFINREEAAGNVTTVPESLINEAKRMNYKELTVEEFEGIKDAIKNIEHLGKLKASITIKRKKMQYEQVRDELLTGITSSNPARKESANMSPSKMELFKEKLEGLDAAHLKIEQLVEWLDAGDINGPARRYIWQPLADAEIMKNDMLAEYTSKIAQVFESVDSKYMNDRITVPQVGKTFTVADIYGVALNMGNHSNYRKMKAGEGKAKGGREWTDEDVKAITDNLKKEDWDRIQQIWDHVNSLWTQVYKLQRRLTGTSPKKVEARPVETPHGQYKGGYYPVVYDKRRATDVANREALANEQQFPNTYINPTTPHGHTKERSEGYSAPMSYDLMNMANHLNKVVHDLTHREAVRNVHKLLTDADVASAIRSTLGEKYREEFTLWTKYLAHERIAGEQEISSLNSFVRKMRTNATLVGIGFRFSTMMAQATGFSQAKEMVSGVNLGKGIKMAASDPVGTWEFVKKASGEMRHRSDQMDRDVREGILSLDKFRSAKSQVQRFAYYGVAMADRAVVVPVWMGAYMDQMAKTPGDEQAAIAYADKTVRLSQGSGGAKDLARIQRGNEFQKLITMFYSYFSAMYARGRNLTRDVRRASMADIPNIAARALYIVALPAILGELLTGRGPDDDENPVAWAATKMALYPFMAIAGVRDVVSYFSSGQYTATPAARAIETLAKLFTDLGDASVEAYGGDFDDATARKLVKDSLLSAGYVFGLPTGQLATTVDNIWKGLDEGDLAPRDIFFTRQK